MEIEDSKNIVTNSNFTNISGSVRIGDEIHYHNGQIKIKRLLTNNPFDPNVFLGRDGKLQEVHDRLFAGENFLMLVNGQGGIGKTSFVAKYWKKYESEYSHLAFLYVGDGIANQLLSLAPTLGLKFEKETDEERFQLLGNALANLNKPCLLVLDNANDENDLNNNIGFLRRQQCNFHILFTSRLADYEYAQKYTIESLDKEVALQVFKEHYKKLQESEKPLFEEIYDAVGGNTLVLEILAKNLAYLNQIRTKYTLETLKKDLENSLLKLSMSGEVITEYHAQGTGIRKEKPEAIILAMYDLSELSEAEKVLLSVFAVLPAESIAIERLTELLPEYDIDNPLSLLVRKGWVEQSETTFKISPVVQEIVRHKNKDRLYEDCRPLIERLTQLLRAEHGQYHLNFKWLPYTQTIRKLFADRPDMLDFNNNLALVLKALGGEQNLRQAQDLLQKALASDIANFGEHAPVVARSQSNLAMVFKDLGGEQNLRQAQDLLQKALASNIKNFGEHAPTVAISQSNLALVLQDLGGEANLLKAQDLLQKALASDIANFGEHAPAVARSQSNLATVLQALGGEANLLKAQALLQKALASAIANFGEHAPTVAISQSNLALVFKALGGEENLRQAQDLLQKAYATCLTLMGERHYYTQKILGNLFALYVRIRTGKPMEQCTEEELFFYFLGFKAWLEE